jgi:hypothetical protein
MHIRFQSILLIMAVGLAACNLSATATKVPEPTAASDTGIDPVENTLTETHVDSELGLAIDYPAGWRIEGHPGELVQIFSPLPSNYTPHPGGEPFPADQTKIEIIPQHSGDSRSIAQIIADLYTDVASRGDRIEVEEPQTLASGLEGMRLQYSTGIPLFLTEINAQILYVAGYGDVSRFNEIVNTLRPAS